MLAPGQLIGDRLRVERIIGAGGMGVVACARHLELQQDFAVKMLKPELANDAKTVDRFLREARAVAGLRTEHVCRVFDVARTSEGVPYIVMEMLQGGDLQQMIASRPLPPSMAVEYILQACIALAEAHRLGIVHRDLKPANLFVVRRADGGPLVKVLDFGIAKAADELRLTGTMTMLGSPPYMSPEQLMSPRDVDARSDIWSLGVSLYQMLCGAFPFAGASVGEMAVSITTAAPRPLDVEPGLSSTIMRCFEKDQSRRWQDIASLAAALAPFGGPSGPALAAAVRAAAGGGTIDMRVPPMPPPTVPGMPVPGVPMTQSVPGAPMPYAVGAMSASQAAHPSQPGFAPMPMQIQPGASPPSRRIPIWVPICIAIVVGAVIVGVLLRGSDKGTTTVASGGSAPSVGSAAGAPTTPLPPPVAGSAAPPATPSSGLGDPSGSKPSDPWASKPTEPSASAGTPKPKTNGVGSVAVESTDRPDDDTATDPPDETETATPSAPSNDVPMPGEALTADQRTNLEKQLKEVDQAIVQYGSGDPRIKASMSAAGATVACMLRDGARAKRYLANIADAQQRSGAENVCRMYGVAL